MIWTIICNDTNNNNSSKVNININVTFIVVIIIDDSGHNVSYYDDNRNNKCNDYEDGNRSNNTNDILSVPKNLAVFISRTRRFAAQ